MPLPSTGWHKSSYSSERLEACVEACVRTNGDGVLIRDSKDHAQHPLSISPGAWQAFLGDHLLAAVPT
ncbi:DUF397 domain-containing protein [Streptomyces anulatus]|uniref:DUF397 domain-containing protein n=1 Tax=Streptomyces anulatus TaxID=1892 RepID=UPI003B7AF412